MTHPHSEADARQQIIDHRLRLAGWNVDDPSQVIQELDIYVEDGTTAARAAGSLESGATIGSSIALLTQDLVSRFQAL